jgi:hypothetical protein
MFEISFFFQIQIQVRKKMVKARLIRLDSICLDFASRPPANGAGLDCTIRRLIENVVTKRLNIG